MKLLITFSKPNPFGKDLLSRFATARQLGGEWVDIKNIGSCTEYLNNIELNNYAYDATGAPKWSGVCILSATLRPLETLRVHSGKTRQLDILDPQDISGAEWHSFTGRDHYFLNNDRLDRIGLWNFKAASFEDQTFYAGQPPEGAILVRNGEQLVPIAELRARW